SVGWCCQPGYRPPWAGQLACRSRASELDFCPFEELVMGRQSWQNRTTLLGTWVLRSPMPPQQGGPHAGYTRLRPARPLLVRTGVLPPHVPTLPRLARRRHPHHRPSHRLQPPPHGRSLGTRRPLQLSPHLLETTLVRAQTGPHLDPVHPRSLG